MIIKIINNNIKKRRQIWHKLFLNKISNYLSIILFQSSRIGINYFLLVLSQSSGIGRKLFLVLFQSFEIGGKLFSIIIIPIFWNWWKIPPINRQIIATVFYIHNYFCHILAIVWEKLPAIDE